VIGEGADASECGGPARLEVGDASERVLAAQPPAANLPARIPS
jgi:hypothetical protein